MQELRIVFLCDLQHVARTSRTDHQRLDAESQIVHGARRRCKVEDIIHALRIELLANVLLQEFELRFVLQMAQIFERASAKVVDAENTVSLQQSAHQLDENPETQPPRL